MLSNLCCRSIAIFCAFPIFKLHQNIHKSYGILQNLVWEYQDWKRSILTRVWFRVCPPGMSVENLNFENLPSYTLASGIHKKSYECQNLIPNIGNITEALEIETPYIQISATSDLLANNRKKRKKSPILTLEILLSSVQPYTIIHFDMPYLI